FASWLAGVIAQSELRGRLALLKKIDGLTQRLGELLQLEVAQAGLRLELSCEDDPLRPVQIDRQRRNGAHRRRLDGEPDPRRPEFEPAPDEVRLAYRQRVRIGKMREQSPHVTLGAARVRLVLRERAANADPCVAVLFGKRIQRMQRPPHHAGYL